MQVTHIAASGLQAAQQRMHASAHNTANLQTEDFDRHAVQQQAREQGGVDARTVTQAQEVSAQQEVVEQISASYAYLANLQVLRTDDRMRGSLLDEHV